MVGQANYEGRETDAKRAASISMTFAEGRSWSGAPWRLAVSGAGHAVRRPSPRTAKRCHGNSSACSFGHVSRGISSELTGTKEWAKFHSRPVALRRRLTVLTGERSAPRCGSILHHPMLRARYRLHLPSHSSIMQVTDGD
jgi:hypothetical protein